MKNLKKKTNLTHNILDLFSHKKKALFTITDFYVYRSYCTSQNNTGTKVKFWEKIEKIKNNPIVKLGLKNLIIGSLLLILIKLVVGEYLTIWSRLTLLIIFTLIAIWFDLRERVKFYIAIFLKFCLGFEFYSYNDDFQKEDYLIIALPEGVFTKGDLRKTLYTIKFELIYFFQYLFQRFFIIIHYIRLFFDVNPIIYIIVYYNIFFAVLYYSTAYVMSYIGLFLIFSRLLIYISENNFSEVKIKLMETGLNLRLKEERLKITKNNVMIFLFWNIRELSFTHYQRLGKNNYENYISYIYLKNNKYNFCEYFYKEIPFDFQKHNYILEVLPFVKVFQNQIFNSSNFIINDSRLLKYQTMFDIINNHDGRYYKGMLSFNGEPKFIGVLTSFSSCIKSKEYLTPLGSVYIASHTNRKLEDSTHEVPVCYWEASSLEELDQLMKSVTQVLNMPKFVEKDLPLNLDYKKAICISDNRTIYTIAKKNLLDVSFTGITNVKTDSKNNPSNSTFGEYSNYIRNNDFKNGAQILDNIKGAVDTTFFEVRGKLQTKLLSKGIAPTEESLLKEPSYKKVLYSKTHVEETFKQQSSFRAMLNVEIHAFTQNKQLIQYTQKNASPPEEYATNSEI